MPTQSSIASFTTPSASTCPATASAEPARNHPTRVDRTKRSVSLITRQRGSTPWATSCRNTGRHQIGMPGRLHRNRQPCPVVDPNHGRRDETRTAVSSYDAQQCVVAHRQHQPADKTRRGPATQGKPEMVDDMVEPGGPARPRRQHVLIKALNKTAAPAGD